MYIKIYRSSLITPPRFALVVPSMPVKRWNFHKAKWSRYIALTNKLAKNLLPPDSLDVDAAYQDFCNIINKAAKRLFHAGIEKATFRAGMWNVNPFIELFCNSSLTATALLAKLVMKRRD